MNPPVPLVFVRQRIHGFSLVELAVVLAIVGLLLGGLMLTLSAQVEQRNREETQRKLEQARDLLLAFAVVNGRLPCPARCTDPADACKASVGEEVRNALGECRNPSGIEDYRGGTLPDGTLGGFLPARTIGFQPVDTQGFALDAWGNRIRYAVASTVAVGTGCPQIAPPVPPSPPPDYWSPPYTNATNLRNNGISCSTGGSDLRVCSAKPASGISCDALTNSGATAVAVTNQKLVAAIVLSIGKNGATRTPASTDNESANLDGDALFAQRPPDPAGAADGEFDDMLVWIPVGLLYSRMIAAGVLP